MTAHRLQLPTTDDWLADAERYERWAARTGWNAEVSATFRRLAEEARARAGASPG